MKMKKQLDIKKLLLLNMPYILMGLFATNFGEGWRMAVGCGRFGKNAFVLLHAAGGAGQLVAQPAPLDLLVGCAAALACDWPCISKARTPRSTGTVWSMAAPAVRPFLSDKYDITKHPNYPYTPPTRTPRTPLTSRRSCPPGSSSSPTRSTMCMK